MNPNYKETGVAILSGITSTTKESRTVVVQMFGTEKISVAPVKSPVRTPKAPPTTLPMQATTTPTSSTSLTTTTKIAPTEIKVVNATESVGVKNNDKVTLITNIVPVLQQQSDESNKDLAMGLQLVSEVVKPETVKTINNSFGIGLLFLGIFGIINISSESSLTNSFKRKLFLRNAFVLIIALGFLLNNITHIVYQIRIPTI